MNEAVTVDPSANSVTINGRIVADKVDQGAQHRIYFVPSQGTPTAYSN
jgi:hypothetical protein